MTLLTAGHETTATSLAWAVERLVRHPGGLERLAGDPAYVDAVVKETLRLRPVVALVLRKLLEPLEVGGHELPAGTTVAPVILLVHRREDVYPEPEAFRPERFLDQRARAPTAGSRSAAACAAAWAPPSPRSRCRPCCRRWPSRCAWRPSAAPSPCAGAASRSPRRAAGRCARSRLVASRCPPRSCPTSSCSATCPPECRRSPSTASARCPTSPRRTTGSAATWSSTSGSRARIGGVSVVDLACGEGYGSDVLARSAYSVVGVDANPDAHEHARLRYRAPNLRFVRNMVEMYSEPCDAVVFLQTIEHVHDPDGVLENVKGMLRAGGAAYVSTPNVLTLAPAGAERSGNPWHLREYRAEEFRALCEAHFGSVELYGLFHARRAARPRAGAARRVGSGPRRAAADQAVLRPLRARHLHARLRPARRARPRSRAGLRGRAEAMSDGRLAIVLHSHLPYVEGFGTWPFGEEWLWEAIATSYLPLLDVLRAGARSRSR